MRRDLLLECAYIRTLTDNDELVEITEGYMDHAYDLFHKSDPSLTKDSFYSSLFKLAETAHNFNDDNSEEDDSDYNDTENQAIKDHDKTSRVSQEQKEALRNQARKKDYGERFRREASYRAKEFKARMFNEEELIYLQMYNEGILTEDDMYYLNEGKILKKLLKGAAIAGTVAAAGAYGYGKHIMKQNDKDKLHTGLNIDKVKLINNRANGEGNTLGRINMSYAGNGMYKTIKDFERKGITNFTPQQVFDNSNYKQYASINGKHFLTNKGHIKKEMGIKDYMNVGLKGITSRFNNKFDYTDIHKKSKNK